MKEPEVFWAIKEEELELSVTYLSDKQIKRLNAEMLEFFETNKPIVYNKRTINKLDKLMKKIINE